MSLIERNRERENYQVWEEIKSELGQNLSNVNDASQSHSVHELVAQLARYSESDLDPDETLHLFKSLIETGLLHLLPGHFQRMAYHLVHRGNLDLDGEILFYGPFELPMLEEK